jgi:hypothetical protein
VVLCGSILPIDFPWDLIIDRGQVQAVRNEFGIRDKWVVCVRGYVRGTGQSGYSGFTRSHERLVQQEFDYNHSDFFERDHMQDCWLPFIDQDFQDIPKTQGDRIARPISATPWGAYISVASALSIFPFVWNTWSYWRGGYYFSWPIVILLLALIALANVIAGVRYSRPMTACGGKSAVAQ